MSDSAELASNLSLIHNNLSDTLSQLFEKSAEKEGAVEVISLSTADGFPVQNFMRGQHSFEPDTMAAAASTLFSVSNAVANQILSKDYKSTFIEADQGNVFFICLKMANKDFVLAVCASAAMNIASLRLFTNRLATAIIDQNL